MSAFDFLKKMFQHLKTHTQCVNPTWYYSIAPLFHLVTDPNVGLVIILVARGI